MRRNNFFSVIITVLVVLTLFCTNVYSQTDLEQKIKYLNEQLTEKQNKIDELYKDLDLYGDLLEKLTDKQGGETTADNLVNLKKEIASKNKQTDSLRISLSELKKEKDALIQKYEEELLQFQKEQKNIKEDYEKKTESLNENIAALVSTTDSLNGKLLAKDEMIESLKKDMAANNREVIKKEENVILYEKNIKDLEIKIKDLVLTTESLKGGLSEKDQMIEVLKKEIDETNKKQAQEQQNDLEYKTKAEKLEEGIKLLESKLDLLNKDIAQKNEDILKLQTSMSSLSLEKDNSIKTLEKKQQEVLKLKQDNEEANKLFGETNKELLLKKQTLEELQKKINDSDVMIESFKKQLEQSKLQYEQAQKVLIEKEKSNNDLQKQISEINITLQKAKKDYEDQKLETINMSKNADSIKTAMDQKENLLKKEIETSSENLSKAKQEISVLQKDIAEGKQKISILEKDLAAKESNINILNGEKKNKEDLIIQLNSTIDSLRASLQEKEQKAASVEKSFNDSKIVHQNEKAEYEKTIGSLNNDIKQKQLLISSNSQEIENVNKELLLTKNLLSAKEKEYSEIETEYKAKTKEFEAKEISLNENIMSKQKNIGSLEKELKKTTDDLNATMAQLSEQKTKYDDLVKLHNKKMSDNEKELSSLDKKINSMSKKIETLEADIKDKGNIIEAKTATVKKIDQENVMLQKDLNKMNKDNELKTDTIRTLQRDMSSLENKFSNKEKEYLSNLKVLEDLDKNNKRELASSLQETEKYKKAVQALLDGTYEDVSVKQQRIDELTAQLEEVKNNLAKEMRLSVSKSDLLSEVEQKLNVKEEQEKAAIDDLEQQVISLKTEAEKKDNNIDMLKKENKTLVAKLNEDESEVSRKFSQLGVAMAKIQEQLQPEIDDYKVELELSDKGIEMTVLTDKLFNSGSAQINVEGQKILDDISEVLKTTVESNKVEILGHTDNTPIKYSDWNSNWELSTARALSVLGYFVDDKNMQPNRFSVIGCGEYVPVADNATEQGRKKNRRVDIIIQAI
ncbi:MAG: OmpA family protein [Candidatus Omnitrophica bacterium]|nr:OmpA family protein [Candidatus Omnitrophota bacterium]